MQKNKLLCLIIGCFFISTINAWDVVVNNRTDGEIKATVELAATSNYRYDIIPAGGKKTFSTGAYCPDMIRAEATSGRAKGRKVSENPPATGFGIGCKNIKATVKNRADAGLAIEFD